MLLALTIKATECSYVLTLERIVSHPHVLNTKSFYAWDLELTVSGRSHLMCLYLVRWTYAIQTAVEAKPDIPLLDWRLKSRRTCCGVVLLFQPSGSQASV